MRILFIWQLDNNLTKGQMIHWIRHHNITSNISRTLVGNKIVDHSDVVGASPVGAAPTTSSFSTWHLVSMDWAKTTARKRLENIHEFQFHSINSFLQRRGPRWSLIKDMTAGTYQEIYNRVFTSSGSQFKVDAIKYCYSPCSYKLTSHFKFAHIMRLPTTKLGRTFHMVGELGNQIASHMMFSQIISIV